MLLKSSLLPRVSGLAISEKRHPKRPRIMNTPPDDELLPVSRQFSGPEPDPVAGNEAAITASWSRLLRQLRQEIQAVTDAGSRRAPTINFDDLSNPQKAHPFLNSLHARGTAIIRNVVPRDDAETWSRSLDQYLVDNSHPSEAVLMPGAENIDNSDEPRDLFWSPAQLGARAHPNILTAQRFFMSKCWHDRSSSSPVDPGMWVSTRHPVAYADRVRITKWRGRSSLESSSSNRSSSSSRSSSPLNVLVDGDGASMGGRRLFGGKSSPYRSIWTGRWEEYDPWDSTARLRGLQDDEDDEDDNDDDVDEDEDYDDKEESRSNILRMFNGVLALSVDPLTASTPTPTCPLSLRLTTAYQLLRPLFTPKRPLPSPGTGKPNAETIARFLDPSNWALQDTNTTISAAAAAAAATARRELNEALRLISTHLPPQPLATGDYMIWHPDTLICSPGSGGTSTTTTTTPSSTTLLLPLPASPLTRSGAVFLARQRRAFLLGFPGPDYAGRGPGGAQIDVGESCHLGRPGVQEIYEAGGEEGLRAMGLLAWEERGDEGVEHEGELVQMANGILFPDRAQWRKGR